MAANTAPLFVLTPVIAAATLSTGNTARDGTGTLVTLATGGAFGTRLDRVTVQATGTTTAGQVRFFIDGGSGTIYLIKEIAVTAATPSGTVQAFTAEWVRSDTLPLLVLPNGMILKASTHNAETFQVVAYGGSF